jgi:hypothetical protein
VIITIRGVIALCEPEFREDGSAEAQRQTVVGGALVDRAKVVTAPEGCARLIGARTAACPTAQPVADRQ